MTTGKSPGAVCVVQSVLCVLTASCARHSVLPAQAVSWSAEAGNKRYPPCWRLSSVAADMFSPQRDEVVQSPKE